MPTWNPAPFASAVSAPDEGSLPSSLPVRTERLAAERPRYWIKRALDLTGAMVGLVLLAPVMLAVALWIRLDSPGPILFRQARRGLRGRPFRVLNFRTMVVDAE
jgi:lipopolysaccharide/colanic/teichoic acid biosynthesis glycosyltransferase